VLISGDLGFSNLLEFPLGSHPGIVLARLPNELSISRGNQILIAGILEALPDLRGSLLIVEPGQIRIRTVPKG